MNENTSTTTNQTAPKTFDMQNIMTSMDTTSKAISSSVATFKNNLKSAQANIKNSLNKHTQDYRQSISEIFKLEGAKKFFFWLCVGSSIVTPIVLIFIHFR